MSKIYRLLLEVEDKCKYCKEEIIVKVPDSLDFNSESLNDDLDGLYIREAEETQKADDGWVQDYCPRCVRTNAHRFAQEQDADDYCSRDKSQDIY